MSLYLIISVIVGILLAMVLDNSPHKSKYTLKYGHEKLLAGLCVTTLLWPMLIVGVLLVALVTIFIKIEKVIIR